MGCENIVDKEKGYFVFACNTSETAFGPLFHVPDDEDVSDVADEFRKYLKKDPREFDDGEIMEMWIKFRGYDDE